MFNEQTQKMDHTHLGDFLLNLPKKDADRKSAKIRTYRVFKKIPWGPDSKQEIGKIAIVNLVPRRLRPYVFLKHTVIPSSV
jgi:hypothetical protein